MPKQGSRWAALKKRGHMLALASCFTYAACTAGSGKGLDAGGRPLDEGGDIPLAATLESIQANVFNPSCVLCHSGANAPLALRLDRGNSYAALVGVRSRQVGSLFRVEPGNPDASYLVRKLEGTAGSGGGMPLEGPPIPQATIDFIRQWILDGAPDDAGPAVGLAPRVTALTPAPGYAGSAFPGEILAAFDRDVDASTINPGTFLLVASGGDGGFDEGNEVIVTAASVGLSAVNFRLAVMDLTGVTAVADRYRVILRGDGPSVILGNDAVALDGDYAGSLPSGDGVAGGDFVAEFDITGVQPTLASIQDNVFTPTCATSGCHTGPAGGPLPSGLDLSSRQASAASLIGVASVQQPMVQRVAANDSNNSYLVQKLEGTAATGARMPRGAPALDQATIDAVRQWIDAGAAQ